MTKLRPWILLAALALAAPAAQAQDTRPAQPLAAQEVGVLKTSLGTMAFRFYEDDAPATVRRIKDLIRQGFYDGKSFYRVVKGHVIQTGNVDGVGPNVKGEFASSTRHPHVAGVLGLARDADPDSGNSEIYICLAPRPHLDGKYAVFGELIEGMDVLEKIGNVEVNEKFLGSGETKVAFHEPKVPVVIEKAWLETRPAK
ncbi:MAG TPA: peptidylprolyl isomerase [Thermoanaerobaculia bacterium]|nr:peptidylprolyl isomerase [Thermoanaerobaculia bacterium]